MKQSNIKCARITRGFIVFMKFVRNKLILNFARPARWQTKSPVGSVAGELNISINKTNVAAEFDSFSLGAGRPTCRGVAKFSKPLPYICLICMSLLAAYINFVPWNLFIHELSRSLLRKSYEIKRRDYSKF